MQKTIEQIRDEFENSERKMRETARKKQQRGQKNQQKAMALRRIFNEKKA